MKGLGCDSILNNSPFMLSGIVALLFFMFLKACITFLTLKVSWFMFAMLGVDSVVSVW